ncbi:MAG TPA: class I SAM-dependent methyltransferase [Gaiellaceae bacterium]
MTGGADSLPEVHRLLAVLAAGHRTAEIGTAYGAGAEAIASTARSLVTVEVDPERAAAARERLAPLANVELLLGDWRDVLQPRAPFEVVFVDGGGRETKTDSTILELVVPGGLLVMDDLTPDWPGPDPVRELWLSHPRAVGVEILTTPESAALIVARR